MEIQSPDGDLLSQGAPAGGALVAQVTAEATGPHMIRVRSTRPAERFGTLLSVDALASPDAPALACGSARRLVPGERHQLRPHLAADRFRQRCPGAPGVPWLQSQPLTTASAPRGCRSPPPPAAAST